MTATLAQVKFGLEFVDSSWSFVGGRNARGFKAGRLISRDYKAAVLHFGLFAPTAPILTPTTDIIKALESWQELSPEDRLAQTPNP